MTVTLVERTQQQLTSEQIASIRLAVAQWMRSARAVAEARDALRALHVAPDEIFRRRRAESADARLATLLRLAVTLVITRGALEECDRRRYAPLLDDDVVQSVVQHVANTRQYVSRVERTCTEPTPNVDLDVGDY
ncbi:MAG TPA: hypothetical protein VGU66_09155 [Candidatus Elarobacter sp.]|nr:hypothetical protein [Candidatus Elarobacter sp.]